VENLRENKIIMRRGKCYLHDTSSVIIFSMTEPAKTGFSALHLKDFSFSQTEGAYLRVLTVAFLSSDTYK
jgi:hypothetical protein